MYCSSSSCLRGVRRDKVRKMPCTTVASVIVIVIMIELQSSNVAAVRIGPVECGVPKIKINEVIRRGRDTVPGQWPWHTAIYHRSDGKSHSISYTCGGTIISSRFVLTADHCVKDHNGHMLSPRRVFVKLGVHNLVVPNPRGLQDHGVLEIHQFVDHTKRNTHKNDIALIELSTSARFTDFVQPVCISTERDLTGQVGTVPGWGYTEFDETSAQLKVTKLPVIETRECLESDRETFGQTLDRSLFCAGYLNGTGVCNGDSGGGLVFKRGAAWYLGGIVSYTALRDHSGNLCKTDGFAGFTSVHHFLPWIREITNISLLEEPDAEDIQTCVTPDRQHGACVAIDQCRNVWAILTSPIRRSEYSTYLRLARCTLPGVERSICCHLGEIRSVQRLTPHPDITESSTHHSETTPHDHASTTDPSHDSTTTPRHRYRFDNNWK